MTDNQEMIDLTLLRRFEPVIRYTGGECFYPFSVERYIKQCSLWLHRPKKPDVCLVPTGSLTLERLIEQRPNGFDSIQYVKFIEPLDLVELAKLSISSTMKSLTGVENQDSFRAGLGRLARVGYVSRLLDAIFSLTLLLRGRVPGDTAKAAALTYQQMQAEQESFCYYGRVHRQEGWIVLQYWFFYPFNNWRTGFFGINDHEGDWEMISLYCTNGSTSGIPYDPVISVRPVWIAYASHDFSGDDLRRRWDDPEVEKIGDHPVVYSGAGSHASYFSKGEYLAEVELPFLTPIRRIWSWIETIWVNTLRQAGAEAEKSEDNVFRVPFIDYARGDGITIGPGQDKAWQPALINPPPGWVKDYRGLWGLYAKDPISGENAPAGPMYNRDGTVRKSWYDPVGWCGLDKITPPERVLEVLHEQRSNNLKHRDELVLEVEQSVEELKRLGVETAALQGIAHMETIYNQQVSHVDAISEDLDKKRQEICLIDDRLNALDQYEKELARGDYGPLRAHIHRAHLPWTETELRLSRLAEAYSAVSIGVLMIGIVLLVVFASHYILFGLAVMIGALIFIESSFRRRLSRLVTSLSVALAIVTVLVLLFEFFWQAVVVLVLLAGLYIVWENVREISG